MVNLKVENRPLAEVLEAAENLRWRKFGTYPPNAGFLYTTVWGEVAARTDVAYLTAVNSATIVSDSLLDNGVTPNTGARTVFVRYLDKDASGDLNIKEVPVTLNGTTPVTIAPDVYRILKVAVTTAGSGGLNVGTLLIKDSGGTLVLGRMKPGVNHDQQLYATVPSGYTGVVKDIAMGSSASASYELWVREEGGVWYLDDNQGVWAATQNGVSLILGPYAAKVDLEFKGNGTGTVDQTHGAVFLMLPD